MSDNPNSMPEKILIESQVLDKPEDPEKNHDELSLSNEGRPESEVQNRDPNDIDISNDFEMNPEPKDEPSPNKDKFNVQRYFRPKRGFSLY